MTAPRAPGRDTICIRGLKVETIIGHHEWERRLPRTLVIDVELAIDAARAARDDALADAIDYDAVARSATAFVTDSRFTLIETLAEKLAQRLLEEFGVPWLRLTVHKPGALPAAQGVSATVERSAAR